MSKIIYVQHITSNPDNHLPDRVRVVARKGFRKKRVWEFKNLSTDYKAMTEYTNFLIGLVARGYQRKGEKF